LEKLKQKVEAEAVSRKYGGGFKSTAKPSKRKKTAAEEK
jgi:hypothetical protein